MQRSPARMPLFALPTFYTFVHRWQEQLRGVRMIHPADVAKESA